VLATKVAGYGNEYLRPDAGKTRITKKQILAAVDGSLQRLGTDYIDLYQIHWPDRYVSLFGAGPWDQAQMRDSVPFEEQMEGMQVGLGGGGEKRVVE
jgi:aryl-alcohol dehydrogenase-like predicted oxidoreductase